MFQFIPEGSVTSVKGIKAAGIFCGIKKRKKDLAIIYSEVPCTAAGVFTQNKVVAAPVILSRGIIQKGKKVRAILVNSGNANACTGEKGYNDSCESQAYVAKKLNVSPEEVLISSTGVIGQHLPMIKLLRGIDLIVPEISVNGGHDSAEAIKTTDLKKKSFAVKVRLVEGEIVIGGICKGSGMIMPNMATMLGFLSTDASIDNCILQNLLSASVSESFNKITVDGETSTNDMLIIIANGISGIKIKDGSENYTRFLNGLTAICSEMAKSIASDGEGATKLITVSVNNAKTKSDANKVAKAVANSPLVKTAINGNDANWGRILSAAGNSNADFNPDKITIEIDGIPLLLPGYKSEFNEEAVRQALNKSEVCVAINLAEGDQSSTWWTCDFSENYIKINARYRT
jgi:glutamate N-acetyltransferase / amino-acid N-acetyltransferase